MVIIFQEVIKTNDFLFLIFKKKSFRQWRYINYFRMLVYMIWSLANI